MDALEEARTHLEDIGDLECEEAYLAFGPIMAQEAIASAAIAQVEATRAQTAVLERISQQLGLALRMAESISTFGDLSMVYEAEQAE